MRHYQIFPFGPQRRLLDALAFDLENDAQAIRRALDPEFPFGCELWEGFRFVGRFHAPAGPAAPVEVEPPPAPARKRKPVLLH